MIATPIFFIVCVIKIFFGKIICVHNQEVVYTTDGT